MRSVYIVNIATSLPNAPISNDAMEAVLGQVGDKPSRARRTVLRSNGIQSRYYAIDLQTGKRTHTNAELTAEAIRNLQDGEFCVDDMECLVSGTSLPDQLMPSHAVMVHGELGGTSCEVVGTSGICVAGMNAMKYAYLAVASGEFTSVVATGSELVSSVMRPALFEKELEAKVDALELRPEIAFEKDFLRWMLSDGAGAVLLQPKPRKQGISLRIEWILQRSYANEMEPCMYSGAQKNTDGQLTSWKDCTPESWLADSVFTIKQDVKQLNANIVHYTVEKPLQEIMRDKGLRPEEIDFFLPHYSSEFFRQKLYDGMKKVDFEIPYERWFTNLTSKGNTGSASVYIIIEELYRSGRLKDGQKLLCYVPESGRFSTAFMLLTVCIGE